MANDARGPRQEFDARQLSRARLLRSLCSAIQAAERPYLSNSESLIPASRPRIASRSMSSRVKLYMPTTSRLRSFLLRPAPTPATPQAHRLGISRIEAGLRRERTISSPRLPAVISATHLE